MRTIEPIEINTELPNVLPLGTVAVIISRLTVFTALIVSIAKMFVSAQ